MALSSLVLKTIFAQWKWIVLSIVTLVILFLAFKVYSVFKERDDLIKEKENAITQLIKDYTVSEIERQRAQDTVNLMTAENIRIQNIYDKITETQEAIRNIELEQKRIFIEHDFTKLSNAKPGLIIKPMNKATQERFDEIANTFND